MPGYQSQAKAALTAEDAEARRNARKSKKM
jgi:hypothetical protein